jgi:hypothetical protein
MWVNRETRKKPSEKTLVSNQKHKLPLAGKFKITENIISKQKYPY